MSLIAITGASAGIGRAIARRFAAGGWDVALIARGHDGLEGARREVEASGRRGLALSVDVADERAVDGAAERIERELGPIDVWVNDAMATIFCEFAKIRPADFRRATEVTYLGNVWGTHAALKRMLARDRGVIIQIGSALAYRSIPLQSAYCGAKAAIRGYTDSLRSELMHRRSRVYLTMIQMPAFNTPQFDWGRACIDRQPQPVPPIFQPELAAEAVWWSAHHRRRELWVGASAMKAIIGQRVIPGLLDRLLASKAYSGQHTDEPLAPDRRDNLYEPVPGDHGAHGRFDAKARRHSKQFWLTTHRPQVAGVLAAVIAAIVILVHSL